MEGYFEFKIKDNDKPILAMKYGLTVKDFLGNNDNMKALTLNELSKQFASVFNDKQCFAELVKYLYKKNYINNEVIKIIRNFSQNNWLIHIFDIEYPEIDGDVSSEQKKENVLSEIFGFLCQIEDMQKKVVNVFQNLDKYNISENDLKKNLLFRIYKEWIK